MSFDNPIAVSVQHPLGSRGEPTDGAAVQASPAAGAGATVADGAAEEACASLEDLARQPTSIGLSLDHVVSLPVYLVDESDLAVADEASAAAFAEAYPARTVAGVAWVLGGARAQVEALAVRH